MKICARSNSAFPFGLKSLKPGQQTSARPPTTNRTTYNMSIQEAYQILNVSKSDPIEKINKVICCTMGQIVHGEGITNGIGLRDNMPL